MKVIEATRQAGRRINRKMLAMTVTGVLVSAGSLALAAVAAAGPTTAGTGAARSGALLGAAVADSQDYRSVCPPAPPGQAACTALIRTDLPHHLQPPAPPHPSGRLWLRAAEPAKRLRAALLHRGQRRDGGCHRLL